MARETRPRSGVNAAELARRSTRPQRVRRRVWPTAVVAEIRRLRTQHGNLGKEKLHPLIQRFCTVHGLPYPAVRTIPGAKGVYCSIDPNRALGVVARATGEPVMDTFDRLLGEPMQIATYAWPLSPAGQPYGGGGMQVLPRDFMKLGQLMLNGGTWRGRRILAAEFVSRAAAPLHDLYSIQYGLRWWNIEYPYKDRTVRAYFAGGNGGQIVLVVPELDLVVATYGGNYSDRVGLRIQQDDVPNLILPAVREAGDDPNAPVIPRDFD